MLDLLGPRIALDLCQRAYQNLWVSHAPEWSEVLPIIGKDLPGAILHEGTAFGFAVQHNMPSGSKIHVVFRGTEDPGDWLCNVECAPVNGIHGGFYGIWAALQVSVAVALESFPRLPVEFNGHSLGGALAHIGQANTPNSTAITFAAPRCFTTALAADLPLEDAIRFVNSRDIVPEVPGRLGTWSYAHHAPAYRFTGDSFDLLRAHSLAESYGPALSGSFEGPLTLE